MRDSTKQRTSETARALIAERSLLSALKPAAPRAPQDRLRQRDMLQEAARTEVQNVKSLELMLMAAEEKRRSTLPKARYYGPLVKFHSKKGE
jgi:hypothetical protein